MLYGLALSIAAGTVSLGQRIGLGAILAMGLLAGFTAFLQGWWMAFLGRRHWGMLRLLQAIAAAFIVLGMVASLVMGDHPPSRVSF
jgi:cytochrome bd-type quinol oxidase subunit 1